MSIMDINQQVQQPNEDRSAQISNDLLEALAVQKALKDKETAKRALALSMNNNPKTIIQQNEDAMRTTSLSEVTDGVAGVLQKRNADATKNLNRVATRGLPQAGARMNMAAGGIVGYAGGQTVERELTEKEKEELYQAKLSGKIPTGTMRGSTITGDSTTPILAGPPGAYRAPKVNLGQVQEQRAGPYMDRNTTYSMSQYIDFVKNDPNLNKKQKKEKLKLINQITDQTPEKRQSLDSNLEKKFPQFSKFGRLGERKGTIDQPRDVAEMQRQLNFQIANKYKSKKPFDVASGQTMGQKNEIKRDAGPGGGILNQGENLNKAYSAIANKFGLKDPNAPIFNAEGIREPSFPEGLAAAEKFKEQARMGAMPNDLGTRDTSMMQGSKQPRSADVTPKVAPEGIAAAGGKGNYSDYMNVLLRTMAGNREKGGMGLAYADAVDAIKKRDADKTAADLDREILKNSDATKNRILADYRRNQNLAQLMKDQQAADNTYRETLAMMRENDPNLKAALADLKAANEGYYFDLELGPSASGVEAATRKVGEAEALILQQMADKYPGVVAGVKAYQDAIADLRASGQKDDVTEAMKKYGIGG